MPNFVCPNFGKISIKKIYFGYLVHFQLWLRGESSPGMCWWIGMSRVGGVYMWDDGTTVDFNNWKDGETKQNKCVCISVDDNYKWVTKDCKLSNPYICQRTESGSVWVAANQTPNEWLQIDLGSIMKITGIMTQGWALKMAYPGSEIPGYAKIFLK